MDAVTQIIKILGGIDGTGYAFSDLILIFFKKKSEISGVDGTGYAFSDLILIFLKKNQKLVV
jgi:hypothetical protein